jgi:phytoene/squalene synthetase
LFLQGIPLADRVDRRLAIDLDLFSRGGLKILEKIERQDYNVLAARPAISKVERVGLLIGTLSRTRLFVSRMTVEDSYTWCNQVARTQAKNFYYSFLLLSPPQRRAMCAIYAFMRYCDDLSDSDEAGMSASEDSKDKASAIACWRRISKPRWPAAPPIIRYGRPSATP